MSSSSNKAAAVAGTLAGLLVAGLGAYYVYGQRHEPQAAAPAKPPLVASAEQAALPEQTPAAKGQLTREQAVAALMALPELKAWSERIEKVSGGKAHGAVMEYDPQLRAVKGKRYYQFSFVENSSDAATRWESFLIAPSDGEILVDDDLSGEAMSLERWRKDKQPLQRSAPGQ